MTLACLAPLEGTTRPYNPPVADAIAPCWASSASSFTLHLGILSIPLQEARFAATHVGDPPGTLVNGLVRGFVTAADAEAFVFPPSLPLVGGRTLSSVLPGGNGDCASHSDLDVGPDGITQGWWFYFNFTAARVGG